MHHFLWLTASALQLAESFTRFKCKFMYQSDCSS